MNSKVHSSWLFAIGSVGFIIGVVASAYLDNKFLSGIEWVVLSGCLLLLGFINKKYYALFLILISGLILGIHRGNNELKQTDIYSKYINKEVIIRGTVAEDPGLDNDGDLQIRLEDILIDGNSATGNVWVSLTDKYEIKRSDELVINGRLSKGFGNIPAAVFRAEVLEINRKDYADFGRDVRDKFSEGIREAINEPEASLASGFLVGQKTALPEKLDNDLRLLGLTHIVVASGYNLTILVRFARRFLERFSRFTALAGAGFLIYGFMQITGNSPSMNRAALITSLSLVAWYYGRKIHPFVLLPISAAVTIMINPFYAWGDIGWLLSFTSFIGVIILAPLIHAYFWGDKKPGAVRQVFFETLSAQLLTLPIIAFVFGQYSIIALLSNILILPLIPLTMGFTFIAGVFSMIFSGISPIIGLPATILLKYMTSIIEWLATWPISGSEINIDINIVILSYISLFVVIVFLQRRTKFKFRDYNVIE